MNKLFCFAILLVACVPFATCDADSALQEMGWVVEEMNSTELGDKGQYIAVPTVWNDEYFQYIAFATNTTDDPSKFF